MNRQEYFEEFLPFFEAICVELERHDPVKGTSWKDPDIDGISGEAFLKMEFREHYARYRLRRGKAAAANEVDLAALMGMLWLRRPEEERVAYLEGQK